MSSGAQIIQAALREIGIDSPQTPAQATDLVFAVKTLNSMLGIWETWDIELNTTPITVIADELGEPEDAYNGIVQNLALELAGPYSNGGAVISPVLEQNARRNFSFIRGKYGVKNKDRPKRKLSSTTPLGAGDTRGVKPIVYVGGDSGALGLTGGIPGPAGPPGPQGPPGPAGPTNFATLVETIAGTVTDKAIAPDTAHGLFASPPELGGTVACPKATIGGVVIENIASEPVITSLGAKLDIEVAAGDLELAAGGIGKATIINSARYPSISDVVYATGMIPQVSSVLSGEGFITWLPIGANGQVFTSNGTIGGWAPPSGGSPLTTKGDLFGFSTVDARIPVGTNDQVLIADSAQTTGVKWGAQTGGGGGAAFRGALVAKTASQSVPNSTDTTLTWNSETYDTDNIHNNVTNNTRLTVPAGVTRAILRVNLSLQVSTVGRRNVSILKNGTTFPGMGYVGTQGASSNPMGISLLSSTISVIAGDFFEVILNQSSGGNLNVLAESRTSFSMEIVEGSTSTVIGKHTFWIPASDLTPSAAAGCAAIANLASAATRPDRNTMAFDPSSDEHAQFSIAFPKSWNLGTITFQVFWEDRQNNNNGVAWALKAVAISNTQRLGDSFYGTAIVVTDNGTTNAQQMLVTAESGALTIAQTPAQDDQIFFDIFRDVSNAADNITQDVHLFGIKLFYTTDAANDN